MRSLLTQHSRLKMHTSSEVAAPMTWLVLTLLLSSAVYFCLLPLIFCPSIGWHPPTIYISPTHTHVPQAAAVETVKVVTTPVFPQIPRLQASKDFQVVVRLEAPPVAQQKARVPVDLAVVLDVGAGGGGSTGSARLDAVKKAVKFIIGQIHDNDRLAVVGPSPNRRLVIGFPSTHEARQNAEKSVDDLEPRGEFASGAGLEEAVKLIRTTGVSDPRGVTGDGEREQPRALRHPGDRHGGDGGQRRQIRQAAARAPPPGAHVRPRRGARPQGAALHRQGVPGHLLLRRRPEHGRHHGRHRHLPQRAQGRGRRRHARPR
eukprot:XP_020399872.1 uncharacterized protein LOC103638126 isoform X2 [Zea mays]